MRKKDWLPIKITYLKLYRVSSVSIIGCMLSEIEQWEVTIPNLPTIVDNHFQCRYF